MKKRELPSEDVVVLTHDLASAGVGMMYRATLRGKSMMPFIRPGDMITVCPVSPDGIRKYDILVFRRADGSLVAHRLIRVEQGAGGPLYVTRGDSALHEDHPLNAADVLGRVLSVTHAGLTMRMDGFIQKVFVRLWMFLYPAPQWIAPRMMSLFRNKKNAPYERGA